MKNILADDIFGDCKKRTSPLPWENYPRAMLTMAKDPKNKLDNSYPRIITMQMRG